MNQSVSYDLDISPIIQPSRTGIIHSCLLFLWSLIAIIGFFLMGFSIPLNFSEQMFISGFQLLIFDAVIMVVVVLFICYYHQFNE